MEIHHLGYLVEDLETSLETFRILGYKVVSQNRNDARGIDICFIRNGTYLMELVCPFRNDSEVSSLLKKHQNMIYHVCYVSRNIKEDIKRISGGGGIPISKISSAPSIGDANVIFLYSKSVGMIELVELNP